VAVFKTGLNQEYGRFQVQIARFMLVEMRELVTSRRILEMNKKTGIVLLVVGGTLAACCGGGLLMLKGTVNKIQEVSNQGIEFTKQALSSTAARWDVDTFNKYAAAEFKTEENKKKTAKLFTIFYSKLGKLTLLDEVALAKGKTFRLDTGTSKKPTMKIFLEANAQFEKGKGKFLVTIVAKSEKEGKHEFEIVNIKLNSDKLFELSEEEAKKAKQELQKDIEKVK
jgi:hypothetical protein